jgi:MFS family permease
VPAFSDRNSWYFGLSAYWFASSFKWFILLLAILPAQVREIVPEGEENTQWGLVFLIGAIWAMFGPSIFGYLSDRLGANRGARRPFIAIGTGLTVVALAFLAKADTMWMLVVGYLLLQISDDVGTGPYAALIPELVPEERRGRASGIMGVLQLGGQLASGLTGLALGGNVLTIYAAIAGVNVLGALWALYTIRGAVPLRHVEAPMTAVSFGDFARGWVAPWLHLDFRWVWFTRFLVALGFYLIEPYLANFLKDEVRVYAFFGRLLEADPAKTTMPVAIIGLTIALFGAIGAGIAARLTDKFGRKRTIRASGVVMLAVLLPFAFTRDFTLLWCLAVVFGVGYGAYLSADWALAADILPSPQDLGKDMGVWVMSLPLAQFVAGNAGRAIDWGNRMGPGWGYTGAFLVAAIAFVLGTSLVSRVRGST